MIDRFLEIKAAYPVTAKVTVEGAIITVNP